MTRPAREVRRFRDELLDDPLAGADPAMPTRFRPGEVDPMKRPLGLRTRIARVESLSVPIALAVFLAMPAGGAERAGPAASEAPPADAHMAAPPEIRKEDRQWSYRGEKSDETPLHRAARDGREAVSDELLSAVGAEPNATDGDGRMPLYYAPSEAVVRALPAVGGNAKDRPPRKAMERHAEERADPGILAIGAAARSEEAHEDHHADARAVAGYLESFPRRSPPPVGVRPLKDSAFSLFGQEQRTVLAGNPATAPAVPPATVPCPDSDDWDICLLVEEGSLGRGTVIYRMYHHHYDWGENTQIVGQGIEIAHADRPDRPFRKFHKYDMYYDPPLYGVNRESGVEFLHVRGTSGGSGMYPDHHILIGEHGLWLDVRQEYLGELDAFVMRELGEYTPEELPPLLRHVGCYTFRPDLDLRTLEGSSWIDDDCDCNACGDGIVEFQLRLVRGADGPALVLKGAPRIRPE